MYTWHRLRPEILFCRLDMFLISFGLVEKIKNSNISVGFKTDHSLISIILLPIISQRGKGFWKLNCSRLKDQQFVETIKNTIQTTAEINKQADPNLLWDTIKMAIRGEAIKYGSAKKKNAKQRDNSTRKNH